MRPLHAASVLGLALLLACAHGPTPKEHDAAVIHNDLGAEAVRAGKMQDALREYDEALKLDDRLAEAHLGKGFVLEFSFGKLPEAEAEYRQAIELKPSLADAHNNLGQLLAKTGRLDQALAEFDAAVAIMQNREPWVARCNRGQVLWRLGRKAEGQAEMRTCLNFEPRYCQGWRELGRLQLSDGMVKEAVASQEQYVRACDKAPDAHLQLALALLKAGQAARAREAFARCAELGTGTAIGDECKRSGEMLQ
ncbi:MAG TPA: tetratricopeptide repeat protein [Anaeromyxobacteraceae bacterium]|nr:tetratricopeptide repeat protein [Anaeromyxobacteraceae bacterium]